MVFFWILFDLFLSATSTDVAERLASINAEGYPESIIYDTVSQTLHRSVTPSNKAELVEALMTPEVENKLRLAAMDYAKTKLDASQIRQLTVVELQGRDGADSGYCSYSWLSWLPWMGCPAESHLDGSEPNEIVTEETYAKCYK